MPTIEVEGKKIELDDEGYLVHFEDWNEKVACVLADRYGLSKTCTLTSEKMAILKFLREYYKNFGAFPITRTVCRNINQPDRCINEEFLQPAKAWKIAGLPQPEGKILANIE